MLKNYFRSKLTGTSLLHYLGWPTWGHPLTGATPPTTASAGGGEKDGIINQTGGHIFFYHNFNAVYGRRGGMGVLIGPFEFLVKWQYITII